MRLNFYLPDFYPAFYRNQLMADLRQTYPQYFYEGAGIGAVYGSFPGAVWNGGRVERGICEKDKMEYVVHEFNRRGIPCRYTFTNPLLEEKHLYDTYCNLCMEIGNNGMNEVLVNSPILEEYIRDRYPGYRLISSTTRLLDTLQQEEEEQKKDYKLVVLNKNFNNTPELFSLSNKDHYEILVNSYCCDECPESADHYEAVGRAQLNFRSSDYPQCKYVRRNFYELMENKSFVTVEDLYEKYVPAGFCHFKLDGRAFPEYSVMESYLYYMIRPQWRDRVRLMLQKAIIEIRKY